MVTDQSQAVVWKTEQTPFGEVTQTTGTLAQPLRFPGQYADPETGYSYNYFRDYDPSVGRYVQSDPIGLRGGPNTYGYVYQNPIIAYDQFGLWSLSGGAFLGGRGGEIILGEDRCGRFMTMRVGFGAGGGWSVDPLGTRPGGDEQCGCTDGAGGLSGGITAGLYIEAEGAMPFISASYGIEMGAYSYNSGINDFYIGPTPGASIPGSGGGIKAEISGGFEMSFGSSNR